MVVTQENAAVNGSRKLSPQDIAGTLRERIRAGELRAGDRLPTQAELAEEFGVERGTVRQAMKKLQSEGLLSNVSKGSPPRVAEAGPAPAAQGPQPSMVALAPRLAAAFAEPQVRIDVVSYTAETLMIALGEPVRLIHEGRIRPDSIAVRILLPSSDITLAFPVPVEADPRSADRLHRRWLSQRNAQGQVLRHNLRALRSSHGIDVSVQFRALPFTTPVKLYLVNGKEALLAYYTLGREQVLLDDASGAEAMDMYDVGGITAPLFSFEKTGPTSRDATFVDESQKWFDALWATITSDLTLS
ncbi:winged helix-turn-helix domain-containing protein [Streptomyces sp. A1499]|uniref:GntR family transcriptional regulator n=1 Tax=Streptomyces sp. A1499 TaxID=2563104 RepID=UPI00109E71E8|nr:winged helix-turn-helix domain-containing protein [Streptomyces sp. A1499]THC44060.1 GntR family transcriptional regulator [Streptomyces sp. A1499]